MAKKSSDNDSGNQGATPAPPADAMQELASAISEVTALVQQHVGDVEDRMGAMERLINDFDLSAKSNYRALRDRYNELAEQLYDFGVRLGLLPKGTPTPAAAEAAKEPPPDLVHDGVGWVPAPPKGEAGE